MAVPRQFHFVFGLKPQASPFHLAHYLCIRSCIAVNHPEQVHFHYRNEPWGPLWDLIRPELTLRPLGDVLPLDTYAYSNEALSAAYRYAHTSDFLRLAILQAEGGVYADMDTIFLAPFPDHLYEPRFVMGHERVDLSVNASRAGGSLCNALFLAEPGSEFGRIWQKRMLGSFDGSWSRHSTFLPYEISQEFSDTIHVEPEQSFFYLDWTREGIFRLFESSEILPPEVYSLHLWAHLWWDEERTDVSRFHAGRLTPGYVAYADTTYARYARPHLPAGLPLESRAQWRARDAVERSRNLAKAAGRRMARSMGRGSGTDR